MNETTAYDIYERQGFVVLPRLVPETVVSAAREEYIRHTDDAPRTAGDIGTPVIVMWHHVEGGFKRYLSLPQAPAIHALITRPEILGHVRDICGGPVRLLETIVFNKPPEKGGSLAWHQDASFYPLKGGKLVSALIPFDPMSAENGAVSFAPGSHTSKLMSAIDLHSGQRRADDTRATPVHPADRGYDVVTPDLVPGDVTLFHSQVWHGSAPNVSKDMPRRLLSVRYISLDTIYHPVPGNAASFVQQITTPVGSPLEGSAFPIL